VPLRGAQPGGLRVVPRGGEADAAEQLWVRSSWAARRSCSARRRRGAGRCGLPMRLCASAARSSMTAVASRVVASRSTGCRSTASLLEPRTPRISHHQRGRRSTPERRLAANDLGRQIPHPEQDPVRQPTRGVRLPLMRHPTIDVATAFPHRPTPPPCWSRRAASRQLTTCPCCLARLDDLHAEAAALHRFQTAKTAGGGSPRHRASGTWPHGTCDVGLRERDEGQLAD